MTKLLFAAASLLLLPSVSDAAFVKPSSREGLQLVHQAATQVSQVFVAQTDQLQGKAGEESPDCEGVRSNALAKLGELDVSVSYELTSAKRALEAVSCESTDLKKVNDKFFVATLAIRTFEDRN